MPDLGPHTVLDGRRGEYGEFGVEVGEWEDVLSLGGVVIEGRNVCKCRGSKCRDGKDLKIYHIVV